MALTDNSQYKALCQQMNPYLAIEQMAKDTRCICNSLDNRITVSKALDYAAQGKVPNPKDYPDHRLDRVKEYLTYVLDGEIRYAVLTSYEKSLHEGRLTYIYTDGMDEFRKSRTRIILNILWDYRPHKT